MNEAAIRLIERYVSNNTVPKRVDTHFLYFASVDKSSRVSKIAVQYLLDNNFIKKDEVEQSYVITELMVDYLILKQI